jgi:hypothetical protein
MELSGRLYASVLEKKPIAPAKEGYSVLSELIF